MFEKATKSDQNLGVQTMRRLDALSLISEGGDGVTRRFATKEHRQAAEMIQSWMRDAGMEPHVDAAGNVIGRYQATKLDAPTLIIGSHQDTVRQGGKYDGAYGIVAPISCIGALNDEGVRFPFAIEVIAFCDEEGVRFNTTLLGSRAIAGTFDMDGLENTDANGVTMSNALKEFGTNPTEIPNLARDPNSVLGFVEIHIEQGPILEEEDLALGVVTAIAGGTRLSAQITGLAGHAGTVPMDRRRDALTAAAEAILAVESYCSKVPGLVGTVGRISATPGAVNVIPGDAAFTIDIRAGDDDLRRKAVNDIKVEITGLCVRRGVEIEMGTIHESDGCQCAPWLMDQLDAAVTTSGHPQKRLMSGAGHDGMAMEHITDIGMLFIRCEGGISHHPAEAISVADADAGAQALLNFIKNFKPQT
ncbi:MAG: allantoate amidohydrolase [Rhodospirillales bacterium]|nr:allantoate amidohydrolase [Rhodospirillales bacterium]